MDPACAPRRHAFTVKELLVVLVFLAIIVAIMIPAIQRLRESSRQAGCIQNLTNIGRGLADYSLTFTHYPAGSINPTGPIRTEPNGFHHNWISAILPSLDYPAVYELIDPSVSVYAPENAEARETQLPILRCPSDTRTEGNPSNYAGVHHGSETPIDEDNWGMFILNRPLSENDVPDGLSTTLLAGEKLQRYEPDLGWLSGTRATLRNTGHELPLGGDRTGGPDGEEVPELFVGGFASEHPAGVVFLHGDGSVRVVAPTADLLVLQQIADRRDGAAATEPEPETEAEPAEPNDSEPEN